NGRAVFGRHVGYRCAIGHGQSGRPFTVVLDKLADDVGFAQQLRQMQYEIGGGDAFTQRTTQMHAHHVRREEINRLTQHASFRFDATHAPTDNSEAIDHRGMRVGTDERVGVIYSVFFQHAASEIFQIDLMNDTDTGRNDFETVKRLHTPLEELVAGTIAFEFYLHV